MPTILSLQKFAALILQAATSLSELAPIADSIRALVGAAVKSPSVPKKDDGSSYSEQELVDLIVAMQSEAHAAWHEGDR